MTVVLATTVDIDATPAEVWDVLTDFPRYGEWSNFRSITGKPEVGEKVAIKMQGFAFKPTIEVATPETELRWDAKILSKELFLGQHSFALSTNADGTTRVANTETFSGILVKPFERMFAGPQGESGYTGFNRALKRRVESRRTTSGD